MDSTLRIEVIFNYFASCLIDFVGIPKIECIAYFSFLMICCLLYLIIEKEILHYCTVMEKSRSRVIDPRESSTFLSSYM